MTETTASPQRARPLRRDAERNRLRILESAQRVFAVHGLRASLDDVAQHAGVGVGTVYRRFPDKESLVEAIFETRVGEIIDLARRALDSPSGWDGMVGFLRGVADLQAGDRGLREIALSTGYGRSRVAALRSTIDGLVGELVERARQEGTLRPGITYADMPLILFMVGEVAQNSAGVRPRLARRYLDLLIDGLRTRPDGTDLGEPLSGDEVRAFMQGWGPSPR